MYPRKREYMKDSDKSSFSKAVHPLRWAPLWFAKRNRIKSFQNAPTSLGRILGRGIMAQHSLPL